MEPILTTGAATVALTGMVAYFAGPEWAPAVPLTVFVVWRMLHAYVGFVGPSKTRVDEALAAFERGDKGEQ